MSALEITSVTLIRVHSEVSFTYNLINLDNFDEGLELAFYNQKGGEWIPIQFYSAHDTSIRTDKNIGLSDISQRNHLTLRGHLVNFSIANDTWNKAEIRICGPGVFTEETEDNLFYWQFRWLQTAAVDDDNDTDGDVILIDDVNITVTVVNGTGQFQLFEDNLEAGSIR